MKTCLRLTVLVAMLALLVAAGASVAAAVHSPWNLAGVTSLAGMLSGHLGALSAAGRDGAGTATVAAVDVQEAAGPAGDGKAADREIRLAEPQPAISSQTPASCGRGAAAAAPAVPEPVDYLRLNGDVKVVADTLERFNQKLLLMIAQVRAAQRQAESHKPAPPAETADEDAASEENEPES